MLDSYLTSMLAFLATLFIFVIGLGVAAVVVLFLIDICQSKDAIRRNYPIVGRFRYLFIKLGEFFRQYFFAMDREEMPFNRAQRQWVYRASTAVDNTSAFGSTENFLASGTIVFVNCPFPTLEQEFAGYTPMVIGPHCRRPYTAASFFNISGMSYGALSEPAVRALSRGAKMAQCWLNTGARPALNGNGSGWMTGRPGSVH